MTAQWKRRKAKVKHWEKVNKELGRLPYWNDRARYLNNRAKKLYGETDKLTGQELKDLYELIDKKCYFCGCELSPSQAHFDHIKPLKAGGRHHIDNMWVACNECNSSKGSDSADDFLMRVYETRIPAKVYNNLFKEVQAV